jgi:hypothetical protein
LATDHCPRCDTLVEASVVNCPACGLPMHFEGEASDRPKERKEPFFRGLPRFLRKDDLDWGPLDAPLPRANWRTWAAFLAAGILLFMFHGQMLKEWNYLTERSGEEVEVPITLLPRQEPKKISPPGSASPYEEIPSEDSNSALPEKWIISGAVYDLITLQPVSGAVLIFEEVALNRHYEAKSKPNGLFSAELPEPTMEGYALKVRYPGYVSRAFLEDSFGSQRLQSLSKAKRIQLGRDFVRTIAPSKPVTPQGDEPVILFLVPRSLRS